MSLVFQPDFFHLQEVQVTLSLTNPVENVLKISLLNVDEEKGNRDSEETEKENETLSKSQDSTEKEKDSSKDQDNQKDNDKVEEKKDESDNKNEKVDEKEKEEKKEGSLPDTKRADRRVDNKCSSLEFEETAEVRYIALNEKVTCSQDRVQCCYYNKYHCSYNDSSGLWPHITMKFKVCLFGTFSE